jgi:hypothetical protein
MGTKTTPKPRVKADKAGLSRRAEPQLTEREIDEFISRNRDALNASIKNSRRQASQGVFAKRSVAQIIADGRRRHRSKKKD